jgi:hypothetical protein
MNEDEYLPIVDPQQAFIEWRQHRESMLQMQRLKEQVAIHETREIDSLEQQWDRS